jgi:hypothetical protein
VKNFKPLQKFSPQMTEKWISNKLHSSEARSKVTALIINEHGLLIYLWIIDRFYNNSTKIVQVRKPKHKIFFEIYKKLGIIKHTKVLRFHRVLKI